MEKKKINLNEDADSAISEELSDDELNEVSGGRVMITTANNLSTTKNSHQSVKKLSFSQYLQNEKDNKNRKSSI